MADTSVHFVPDLPSLFAGDRKLAKRRKPRVLPYKLALPFMLLMALYVRLKIALQDRGWPIGDGCALFDLSPTGLSVQRAARNTKKTNTALQIVQGYNLPQGRNFVIRLLDHFWMNILNAQAVRRRLEIVQSELHETMKNIAEGKTGKRIRLLSLAAGSAEGVISVIALLKEIGIPVEATLFDIDRHAIGRARAYATQLGVTDAVNAQLANVLEFDKMIEGEFYVIEMCGLLDYLDSKQVLALLRKIRRYLSAGGTFVTCHIHDNPERVFMDDVVKWKMRYRSRSELLGMLIEAGFATTRVVPDGFGIHSVFVCNV